MCPAESDAKELLNHAGSAPELRLVVKGKGVVERPAVPLRSNASRVNRMICLIRGKTADGFAPDWC